ncbi:MAG: hypothetical protein M0017_08310, partial [Desulfobacteraceae bacterium]|nr:hypothetical protein [Desulfobacteraceae bacterium]
LRAGQGLLAGRRAGLEEGREKLAAGACPFFREPCRNIADQVLRDVFTARLAEIDRESAELEKKISALQEECGKAEMARLELDSRTVRARELEKQLAALGARRQENEKRRAGLAGLRKQQEEAAAKAAGHQEKLKDFGNLDAEIARVERERLRHQTERDLFLASQKDAQDLEPRMAALGKMTDLLKELQAGLAAKGQELTDLEREYDPERHRGMRQEKEKTLEAIAALRQQLAGLDKDRLRLEEEIGRLKQVRQDVEGKAMAKKKMEHKGALIKLLRTRVFNHVSARLSERYREEISLRADRIYRTIAETDEELAWGDKYQIILRDLHEGTLRERTDDQLSGGQIMSAVVALRLALLQTIGARIAFFDEPTSNLDAARRENLARAFRAIDVGREEVTEHWYDQLFLISHDVAFTEITDQVITLGAS